MNGRNYEKRDKLDATTNLNVWFCWKAMKNQTFQMGNTLGIWLRRGKNE